ncbi:major facilitator superfamily domain-containing protein [Dissophora ornata]|nr:major facilitator superfamily domain-containing protein [Dissophora ornata]
MTTNSTTPSERRPLLAKTRTTASVDIEAPEQGHREDTQKTPLDEASRLAALQAMPWYRRPSIAWFLPLVFLLAISLGMSQASEEQLIIKIVCKGHLKDSGVPLLLQQQTSYDDDPCHTAAVQAAAALVMSRIRSLKYVIAIFTIGFFTSLSDRYGRKYLMHITLTPMMLSQALIVYMARPSSTLGVGFLYADAVLIGLVGAGTLLEPSMNAYIADCTPREGRSMAIGFVLVSFAVGLIVGPILAGILTKLTGDISSAVIIAIIVQCVLIVYVIVLPESLPKDVQQNAKSTDHEGPVAVGSTKVEKTSILVKMKNGMLAVLDPLLLFLPGRLETSEDVNVAPSQYTLLVLVGSYAAMQFASSGATTIIIPYTNLVFHWTAIEDDFYYSLSGAASFIVYVAIFPGLQKLYKIVVEKKSAKEAAVSVVRNPSLLAESSEIGQLSDVGISNAESQTIEEALHSSGTDAATRNKTVWNDLTFFMFGGILYIAGYLIVGILETEASFLIEVCIRGLASVSLPSFMSLITSYFPVHQTGKALGGLCVLNTIVMTVSSLIYGWAFSKTSGTMPSAVFLISGAFASISVLAGLSVWNTYKREEARK